MSVGFDRIHLDEPGGARVITLQEFLQIPLYKRVQLLLQKRVGFSLAGRKVESRNALRDMRTLLADPKTG
jgi:hypothetical protein